MVPYFLSFDLPKQIVNGPIQGDGFEGPGARQTFMHIAYDIPLIGHVEFFKGLELNRFQMLMALSLVFLALVVLNGLFKFYINTYKGRLGERMLRRIRFELIDRVLRFPPAHFKRVKSAEIATMIKDEVEPMGGFTGDAFVSPALLGGQAITALGLHHHPEFLARHDRCRHRRRPGDRHSPHAQASLELGRQRQLTARELSGRVGRSLTASARSTATTPPTSSAPISQPASAASSRSATTFISGSSWSSSSTTSSPRSRPSSSTRSAAIWRLQGRLDIGQLVAVISAYKDLPGPLKELIDWDQMRQDVQVNYAQVYEQFNVEPLIDSRIQELATAPVAPLTSAFVVTNLSVSDDSGARLVDHVSVEIKPNETVAIVGPNGSGAEAFAEALGRLVWPDSGRITIDGQDLLDLPESITGRRISYASAESYFFHGTLRDNLVYGLKHDPMKEPEYDDKTAQEYKWHVAESQKAGNPTLDLNSDWGRLQCCRRRRPEDLLKAIRPVLDAVMMSQDILDLGAALHWVTTEVHTALGSHIVKLRTSLRERLARENLDATRRALRFRRLQHTGDRRRKPAVRHDEAAADEQPPACRPSLFPAALPRYRAQHRSLCDGPGNRRERGGTLP